MSVKSRPGIPTDCVICDRPLHRHNVTGLCAECKLVARNERITTTKGANA